MAVAKATAAQLEELKRQSNIIAKDMYQLLTQPQDKVSRGPAINAKITALQAAAAAVVAAA